MYTTDRDRPPKRPVVTSLAGALTEVRRWLEENQLHAVKDGDGLAWDLGVTATQIPEPNNPRGLLWQLNLDLKTRVTTRQLVDTATLDRTKDARLIDLIGDEAIELKMRPITYKAPTEDAAKALLAEVLPKLKASFAKSTLSEVKRALVGRFVDEGGRFHGGPA
jgi:hypothetical protein